MNLCLVIWLLFSCVLFVGAVPVRHRGTRRSTFFYESGDGYYYHVNSVTAARTAYLKCVHYERGCLGRGIWTRGGDITMSQRHDVCHRNRYYGLEMLLRRRILKRCRSLEMTTFHTIIREERRRFPVRVQLEVTYNRMRTSMRNARLQSFPPPPASLQDLTDLFQNHNLRVVTMTSDGRDNIYAGSATATNGSHSVLFASRRMLRFARNQPVFFSDGTFKTVPARPEAAQIFTVLTAVNHHVVPIAWILMEAMTLAAYTAVLRFLRILLGPGIALQQVISDYEEAQQAAWNNVFQHPQQILLQGCLFHMARAFVKYAKRTLNLYRFMGQGHVRTVIRLCITLALVPLRLVPRAFRIIMRVARGHGLVAYRRIRPFLSYVSRRWVHHNRRSRWMNCCGSENRTNNISETHNRQLSVRIGRRHPSIYTFLWALRDMEMDAHLDVRAHREGAELHRPRRISSIMMDQRLRNLLQNLRPRRLHALLPRVPPNDDAILNYMRRASYLFENVYNDALDEV